MTTNMDFTSSDLVFRLVDGSETGTFFPVKTKKCLLGNDLSKTDENNPQCAVIRGPKGTAIHSFGTSIVVNGEPVKTQWLQDGDQIQLGPALKPLRSQTRSCKDGNFAPWIEVIMKPLKYK